MAEREPTEAERIKFERAANELAKLAKKGLFIYLANDTLTGESHDLVGTGGLRARQDRIRASVMIPNAGGGDW